MNAGQRVEEVYNQYISGNIVYPGSTATFDPSKNYVILNSLVLNILYTLTKLKQVPSSGEPRTVSDINGILQNYMTNIVPNKEPPAYSSPQLEKAYSDLLADIARLNTSTADVPPDQEQNVPS